MLKAIIMIFSLIIIFVSSFWMIEAVVIDVDGYVEASKIYKKSNYILTHVKYFLIIAIEF